MEQMQNNKKVIKQFKDACNDLAEQVNKQLFDGSRKWYWVGDEVGGVCDFDDCDILKPEDMVLILEENVPFEVYDEWSTANYDNEQFINLKSWLMGCRHDMLKEGTEE